MAKQVYSDLDLLQLQGLVEARSSGEGWSAYRLTGKGSQLAAGLRRSAPKGLVDAMDEKRAWVMQRSFRALLRDVYEQYPEMATKSLFKL
jgi:DNA-binding PadR family transcriptional regulator